MISQTDTNRKITEQKETYSEVLWPRSSLPSKSIPPNPKYQKGPESASDRKTAQIIFWIFSMIEFSRPGGCSLTWDPTWSDPTEDAISGLDCASPPAGRSGSGSALGLVATCYPGPIELSGKIVGVVVVSASEASHISIRRRVRRDRRTGGWH